MAPTEVLCQNRYLSLLRLGLDESDHVEKVLAAEAGAIAVNCLGSVETI